MTKPEVVCAIIWAHYKLYNEGMGNKLHDVIEQLKADDEISYIAGKELFDTEYQTDIDRHKKWHEEEYLARD